MHDATLGRSRGRSNYGSLSARQPLSRGAGVGTGSVAGIEPKWYGRAFYVQIERCSGVSEKAMSVRHDDQKYSKTASMLKYAIQRSFTGSLEVEVVEVKTPYSMEVRVMPAECHPKNGRHYVAQDAEVMGAKTVFSKVATKKWPNLENVVAILKEFCRVPVRIILIGRADEQQVAFQDAARPRSRGRRPGSRHSSDSHLPVELDGLHRLPHVELHCVPFPSRRGNDEPFLPYGVPAVHVPADAGKLLTTNSDGIADASLFPGDFYFSFAEDSTYDRLEPSSISVPAVYAPLEIRVTASLKKQCMFLLTDLSNVPIRSFPLVLMPGRPLADGSFASNTTPTCMKTRADGKCRARLGRGFYVASYDGDQAESPVEPFAKELEVRESDDPQFFRIAVKRIRFNREVMLRTHFQEPVSNCPFTMVKPSGPNGMEVVGRGISSELGIASFELPAGVYHLRLEPSEDQPFVNRTLEVTVSREETGWKPMDCRVDTKHVDVSIHLVTPDGRSAPNCVFHLSQQFQASGSSGRTREMSYKTNDDGIVVTSMGLLEPYVFRIKSSGQAAEYMPQQFTFQTDRRSITAVVARSVFGAIPERRVVVAVDNSGSMGVYIEDIKAALNSALVHQFYKTDKLFNIATFTGGFCSFRPQLVDCSVNNIEDAMRFCETIEAGGSNGAMKAIEKTLGFRELDAVYLVTDGKCDLGEDFLGRLRTVYFSHPGRPKVHTVGINCVPKKLTWRHLSAVAGLTMASFRPVCLMQDPSNPIAGVGTLAGMELPRELVEGSTTLAEHIGDGTGGESSATAGYDDTGGEGSWDEEF